MKRLTRCAATIGLVVVSLLAALSCDTEETCTDACTRLKSCGLLPSPLGTDVDNCAARCDNSDDDLNTNLTRCTEHAARSQVWLDDDATREGCNAVASCLARYAPPAGLLGLGSVAIIADLGEPVAPTAAKQMASQLTSGVACEPIVDRSRVEQRCQDLRAFSVEAFSEQGERRAVGDACTSLLSMVQFRGVSAGPVMGGFVIEGAEPAAVVDAGTDAEPDASAKPAEPVPYCFVLRAERAVVPAGGCAGLRVQIPADPDELRRIGIPCERSAVACADSLDNDGDTRVDCLDQECSALPGCQPLAVPGAISSACSGDAGCAVRPF